MPFGGFLMATTIVTGGSNGILSAESTGDTFNGPVTLLNQATAPAAAAGATVLYSTGGVMTYTNPQGLVNTIVGSQGGLQAAGSAITGGTTETVLQSMSLPANDAIAGAVYKMVGWGVFTSTGTPGNTVFTSRLGGVAGTSLVATANIALTASLTNAQWKHETLLNFLSPTSVSCLTEITVDTAAGGATAVVLAASTSAVTVSLTSTKTWVLDITPGASGNSIQLLGGWSERIA
jgi:hypothetical protein